MDFLAKWTVKRYPELAAIDIVNVVSEFNEIIFKELNYLNEASNMMRFSDMFKTDDRVHIPEVYHEFTTKRLLVMEFINGVPPDRLDKMEEMGINRSVVAENGADIILTMILKYGFFHADPHAGNIFIMPNNVICFIDFGMVGNLKQRHINFMAEFTLGIMKKDPKSLAKALLKLSDVRYFAQMEELEFEMEKILQRYAFLPVGKINIGEMLQESINVVVKYKLHIPSSFFTLLKAIATIEKFAVNLDPNLALIKVMHKHAFTILKSRYGLRTLAGNLYHAIGDYISLIRDLRGEVNEILYKVKEGKLVHEIDIQNKEFFHQAIGKVGYRIGVALILGFLIIGSAFSWVYGDANNKLDEWIFLISSGMAIYTGGRWLLRSK
jgi:ubiquinone biosynthesis protein